MPDLTVRLWNRDLILSPAQVDRLQTYVLDHLARCPDGRQSVSYLVDVVRMDTRMKFPTRMIDAESMFVALGFTLDREYSGRNPGCVRRTYVTL